MPKREDHEGYFIDFQTHGQQLYLRIETAANDIFSFYSPEAWQFFSLDRFTAEQLAKGFPEYWVDHPTQQRPSNADKEAAQLHRDAAVAWLAQCAFPLSSSECYWEPHMDATIRDPHHLLLYPPAMPRHELSSPFEILQLDLQRNSLRHIEVFTWQYYCGLLFHKLLTSRTPIRDSTVIFQPKSIVAAAEVDSEPEDKSEPELDSPLIPDDVDHQRGRQMASQPTLAQRYSRSSERPVQWGPLFYDEAAVNLSHFCISGMTRSGKTTLLKLLFQSLYEDVTPRPRFVLYDAKPNLLPCLFPPDSRQDEATDDQVADAVYLLSPFDSRGTAWDIAADASNPSTAAEIAEVLFPAPDGNSEHEFYGPAVRDVTTELMVVLTRMAAQNWTFYDLLCAMQLDNIQSVLCSTPNGRQLYATYFEGKGMSNVPEDLVRALRTKSALLLAAAYAWSHVTHRVSLRQWVRSQSKSIVLFNDDEHFKANKEINRILLNVLAQTLLAVKKPPARTFLYLDEMEHLGYIEPMTRLIEKGADVQVNLAIAFHDLQTLKKVYGEVTEGILSQASFQAFLKVNSQVTSEWASYQIGTPEVKVSHTSTQSGTSHTSSSDGDAKSESQQTSQSQSENYASRRLVIPDEIRDLPVPAQAKVLRGYFVTPIHSPYLGTLPASKVIRSKSKYLAAEKSEENFYALWPKVEGVSEHCPQPEERYETPDDKFRTLYGLGFRRPGYTPEPFPLKTTLKTEDEQLSQTPPTQAQPPSNTGPTETPDVHEPPTEPDFDGPIEDFEFPDD
ncbi:MAG: type IV secretion system DNA-binding domain-containing protein [Pirellulales bacterium]